MGSLKIPLHEFDPIKEKALESYLAQNFGAENFTPGPDRIAELFSPFQEAFKTKKIVTIAGTNGKGEVAMSLSELLLYQKIQVALWTSPHILSVRERFFAGNRFISYTELELLFAANHLQARHLSYYEFLFYCFCDWAVTFPTVQVVVFEVGLGGAKDAVNLFDPHLCALTSISLDHQKILGNSVEKILMEKLGITRKNTPLLSCLESPRLRCLVEDFTKERDIPHVDLFANGIVTPKASYRERNQLLAQALYNALREQRGGMLPFTGDMTACFSDFKGRFEVMTLGKKRFIFVGAHNVDGWEKMHCALEKSPFGRGFRCALISFSKREVSEILHGLHIMLGWKKQVGEIFITSFGHPKAMEEHLLRPLVVSFVADQVEKGFLSFVDNWKKTFLQGPAGAAQEDILVLGSYYFIGEVQKAILSLRFLPPK